MCQFRAVVVEQSTGAAVVRLCAGGDGHLVRKLTSSQ